MSALSFARQAIHHWKEVGAIAPSSMKLGVRMAEVAEVWRAEQVLELGPGTGSLTAAVLDGMPHTGTYLGLELNEAFVRRLRLLYPTQQFEVAGAQSFDFSALPEGEGYYDVIISGLPWAAFPVSLQEAILDHVLPRLKPGGRFATFAYWGFHWLPAGRRFRKMLHARLPGVVSSRVLWANLPPAFVYVGRKAE